MVVEVVEYVVQLAYKNAAGMLLVPENINAISVKNVVHGRKVPNPQKLH